MHGKCYELKKQLWEIDEMKDRKILTLMMHALHKFSKWWRVIDDDGYYDCKGFKRNGSTKWNCNFKISKHYYGINTIQISSLIAYSILELKWYLLYKKHYRRHHWSKSAKLIWMNSNRSSHYDARSMKEY